FLRSRSEAARVLEAPFHRLAYAGDAQGGPQGPPSFVDLSGNPVSPVQVQFVKLQHPVSPIALATATGSATGVGDIVLRSKYRFWKTEEGGAAFGFTLQLPSGKKRDFHGTGETHLGVFLYLSQVIGGRIEPHLNVGVDVNADDVDRSSLLYTLGATLRVG